MDAALNEETLQQIEHRISKYKKERDSIKENMKLLQVKHEKSLYEVISQYDSQLSSLREEIEHKNNDIKILKNKTDRYKTKYSELKRLIKEREMESGSSNLVTMSNTTEKEKDNEREEHYNIPHLSLLSSTQSLPVTVRDSKQAPPTSTTPTRYISTSLLTSTEPHEPHLPLTKEIIIEKDKNTSTTSIASNDVSSLNYSLSSSSLSTFKVSVHTVNGDKIKVIKSVVPVLSTSSECSDGGGGGGGVREELKIGNRVVVKRNKEGQYYSGLLRYIGGGTSTVKYGDEVCGVELEVQSI